MIELTPDEHKILVDAIQDSATVVHKGRKDMNERIRELALQADGVFIHKLITGAKQYTFLEKDLEKFAELIVRECVDRVTSKANGWGDMTGFVIKESILDCAKDLKEHFGVEE